MSIVASSAGRARTRVAARWAVLAGLLAMGLGLTMGLAHAADAVEASPVVAMATHQDAVGAAAAPHADRSGASAMAGGQEGATCATCGDHSDGAMVACLVTLAVIALVAAVRPLPAVAWVTRSAPAVAPVALPRAWARTLTPEALCVCRT
ncbi:hypothetical protein [Demequina litorisediminis]|uniref:DUF2946 domain-containing protein n=1 Tax=Demequina litorisediminis TaxID=1849022 RepID=A0ABQ6I9J1_9MICO|nr:hypothetical protein [Demequina litorisediminis]GMA34465.1 hypothetical protein GCM10025876_06690 [Demequina litorisediminis]